MTGARPARLETARLRGAPFGPEHVDELLAIYSHPEVAPWLFPHRQPPTREELRSRLETSAEHWREHGFGLWLLSDPATGQPVGSGGLKHTLATGSDEVELAWTIHPSRWGQGLATELARASMTIAFEHLGLGTAIAYTLPYNLASRRVMEKIGMRREREFMLVSEPYPDGLAQVLYRAAGD